MGRSGGGETEVDCGFPTDPEPWETAVPGLWFVRWRSEERV